MALLTTDPQITSTASPTDDGVKVTGLSPTEVHFFSYPKKCINQARLGLVALYLNNHYV